MIVTPAQLLEAIAEHEDLEKTCEVLGIEPEDARRLLHGAARSLRTVPPPARQQPLPLGHRRVRVFSDGAARGNPGPAGAGAVVLGPDGTVLAQRGRFLGTATNNVAEYQGLLLGLKAAQELGAREVEVLADSQLLIRQLSGHYKVKHAGLKPLHAEALRMLGAFERYDLKHVPREENTLADEMSNRAIDEEMS